MKIYLAHQISGLSYDEVMAYYNKMIMWCWENNFEPLCPMLGKSYLRTELEFRSHGYNNPVSTNHAIFERDKWMVTQADIVYADLTGMTNASIGCSMELAWAAMLGKHTVVVMEKDNTHRHAFVLEAADIVFETPEEALAYLTKFAEQEA